MKKLIIYHVIIAAAAGMSGCDSIWTNTDLPEAVKVRFTEMYPTAENVEWDKELENFEAEFVQSERERTALFSATGKLIRHTEEIEQQYLPAPALKALQQQYAGFKLDEAHRVQQNQNTYYEVELERKEEEALLLFDKEGQLLKQQNDPAPPTPVQEQASLLDLAAGEAARAAVLPVPEASWELPSELREVSGIAWLQNNLIACVQDEEGTIYLYDLGQKAVTEKIKFAGPGDYEGIAVVGTTAYILRSDGALYEVADFLGGKPLVTLHKSVLAASQNTEGLAYDKANDRLLLAGKGYDKSLGNSKGIYAFTLADKKMHAAPVVTIPLAQEKIRKAGKKQKTDYDVLQPSSLEFNPLTGEMYMLDAENLRLLTLNQQGQVQKAVDFDKKLLRQPEGLTFGEQGELYIASEGSKGSAGVIVKYPKGF
ncbi:hypothetical protein GCM10023188_04630 [Pontibacter saemangeumensis]|uniref:Putative beta-lactamase-inhibitor-like PepSY-like domain-containing protein n=1 Tax=Pontibacter saemangeumensis TaxID=1084525 RepID=A0ABP8L971_9BACT